MPNRAQHLREQIAALQAELRQTLREQEAGVLYTVRGKKVEFEQSVRQAHARLKTGLLRWLVTNRPLNLLTGPIIYSLIIPLALLDLFVTFYQASCFPVYGIARVRRRDYLVFDRHKLEYLNAVEKFHCSYCAYGNGILAYASEVAARTEAYFCPIKHAREQSGSHALYPQFLEFGEADDYAVKLEERRLALAKEPPPIPPAQSPKSERP